MSEKDFDKTFFVVWLLNEVARSWGVSSSRAYRILQSADIVDGYMLPFFDQLHTMGSEALVEDITLLAQKRGVLS